jgi:hypothetical protein
MKNKVTRGIAITLALIVAGLLFSSNALSVFMSTPSEQGGVVGDSAKADLEALSAPRD